MLRINRHHIFLNHLQCYSLLVLCFCYFHLSFSIWKFLFSCETTSSVAPEGDYPGHPQSHPNVPENLPPLEVNIPSGNPPKSDQSKPELLQPIGTPYPFLHTASDYGFGLMPSLLGHHIVPVEGAEV